MTIPPHSFLTRSLREKPWGYKVSRILAAALAAVDPAMLIRDDFTFPMHIKGNLIRQSIIRSSADQARTIPIHVFETVTQLLRIRRRLTKELEHEPTLEEIAMETGYLSSKDKKAIQDHLQQEDREEALPPELLRAWREATAKVHRYLGAPEDPWSLDHPVGIEDDFTFSTRNKDYILIEDDLTNPEWPRDYKRIFLLGIGKAALPMSISLGDMLGNQLTEGYVLTKTEYTPLPDRFQDRIRIYSGGHPVPDQDGLLATSDILSRLSSLNDDDLVILLISGGSSALFTQPAEGISLSDLQNTNQVLLACGADIQEINTIRKHLSLVKGGQLARHLQPARIINLILSDVAGDPIDMIGSGPTAPDPSTFGDALNIIERYHLENELPSSVIARIHQGIQNKIPETPKPKDPVFQNTHNLILASNQNALQAGLMQAAIEGFATEPIPIPLVGEASQVGRNLANQLTEMTRKNYPLSRPACLIFGGETTVTLTDIDEPGQGGRNLELALSAMAGLDGLSNVALITLATDGEDGTTYAAGAVVTGESYQRCQKLGLDPDEYLQRHDSYSIFHKLDDLIVTGPTGTNVNDLCFLFTF